MWHPLYCFGFICFSPFLGCDEGSHQLSAALWCLLKFNPENGTEQSDLLKKWDFFFFFCKQPGRELDGPGEGNALGASCCQGVLDLSRDLSPLGHVRHPSCGCCSVWELVLRRAGSGCKGKSLLGGSALLLQGEKKTANVAFPALWKL